MTVDSENIFATNCTHMIQTGNAKSVSDQVLDFGVSFTEFAELQRQDKTLSKYFDLIDFPPKITKTGSCSFILRNDILVRLFKSHDTTSLQVLIPASLRTRVFSLSHDTHRVKHISVARTFARISSSFYWPGLRADVKSFCKTCEVCSNNRTERHVNDKAVLSHVALANHTKSLGVVHCPKSTTYVVQIHFVMIIFILLLFYAIFEYPSLNFV